jgi:uncharacterized repeat protein (TIGR01451 family)
MLNCHQLPTRIEEELMPRHPAIVICLLSLLLSASTQAQLSASHPAASAFGRLPIYFEKNLGQTDDRVRFVARGASYGLFITSTETVAVLRKHHAHDEPPAVIRMRLAGASQHPTVEGIDQQEGKSNYFIGNDPSKWRTNVPLYRKVRLTEAYKGIDVVYYGNQRQFEYDLVVKPGADPRQIRLHFEGAERIDVNATGDLVVRVAGGEIRQRLPFAYQESGVSRQQVEATYRRLNDREFGIAVAAYDTTRPLVIDPVLVYSTYLGGGDFENVDGIAVDSSGNAYLTGSTYSINFPTASPFQASKAGMGDAFITKINASGSALVYSTYLGGSLPDSAAGIAIDNSGNAYVAGFTFSTNFPTASPLQASTGGGISDAFVVKLNASGSALLYSTYLGGGDEDAARGIAVDGSGSVYVAGYTSSTNFPTASPIQASNGGLRDAFLSKLNASGSGLVYSTYLGGSNHDEAYGIAVDGSGNAHLAGYTVSTAFPTANPLQASKAGNGDAFVTKVNVAGSALLYSTFLGGTDGDAANGIALDSSGNAYIAGYTFSPNFPTASPLQPNKAAGSGTDAFVAKLNVSGSALLYSTYLGGNHDDAVTRIAVESSGIAYVAGYTTSTNFPTASPLQASYAGGNYDAFVTKLNVSGSAFIYSTYLGGTHDDIAWGLAADSSGNTYVTGLTQSSDFPTANPLQASNRGDYDAFVTKIAPIVTDLAILKSHTGTFTQAQNGATYTITISNIGDVGAGQTTGTVTVTDTLPPGFTATAMSGSGWSCTISPIPTCSRSDALASGSSYPPITLTVNVARTVGTFTNTATVSGGGETNPQNNTASDPTIVGIAAADVPAIDPAVLVVLALALAISALFALRR